MKRKKTSEVARSFNNFKVRELDDSRLQDVFGGGNCVCGCGEDDNCVCGGCGNGVCPAEN